LLANDGPQDTLLMATELLNRRLRDVKRLRQKHPAISDPTPTLTDIERTHILFINGHFKPFVAVGYEYTHIPVQQGSSIFGSEVIYSIPQYGDFFSDMVLHFQLTGLTATAGNLVRCASYIGTRLIQRVRFEVNSNFLDEYDSDLYTFHRNFMIKEDKKRSWDRMVGQELPTTAYLTQNPGLGGDQYREAKQIVSGYQTYKPAHPVIDLWIPLLLWFNTDPRVAIPSVAVPYGQRFIRVLLAQPELLFEAAPAALGYIPPAILISDLYINNIFVNPEIHDIFIKRIGFYLIRVHRIQKTQVSTNQDQIKLDQLKFPVEVMYVGCRPLVNTASIENWNLYGNVVDTPINYPVSIPIGVPPFHAVAFVDANWKTETPTLDTITIETKGVQLYRTNPTQFYNHYLPYVTSDNIVSPESQTMYIILFCMYPGAFQPSGHINLSRSREFYINYTGQTIGALTVCELAVYAVCINFLLVGFGTATLRYNL
jgi:hypothetical protein